MRSLYFSIVYANRNEVIFKATEDCFSDYTDEKTTRNKSFRRKPNVLAPCLNVHKHQTAKIRKVVLVLKCTIYRYMFIFVTIFLPNFQ